MNLNNSVRLCGRMTSNPAVFTNKDGSRKIKFKLAVEDDFTDREGNRGKQFPPCEAFIPASRPTNGIYDTFHEGDLADLSGKLEINSYDDKNGVHQERMVVVVDTIMHRESKSVTEKRYQDKLAATAAAATAPAAEG